MDAPWYGVLAGCRVTVASAKTVEAARTVNRPFHMRDDQGFTLLELLIATILLSIVMTAVYTSFQSTLRSCRTAEADALVYQDLRIVLTRLTRELNNILPAAGHLAQGKEDELEFFTLSSSMEPKQGKYPQILWVQYHFNRQKHSLVRKERVVQGALPAATSSGDTTIRLGNAKRFELADNVDEFSLSYQWIPPVVIDPSQPPSELQPISRDRLLPGQGLPQAIQISLQAKDQHSPSGVVTVSTSVVFQGPTSMYVGTDRI